MSSKFLSSGQSLEGFANPAIENLNMNGFEVDNVSTLTSNNIQSDTLINAAAINCNSTTASGVISANSLSSSTSVTAASANVTAITCETLTGNVSLTSPQMNTTNLEVTGSIQNPSGSVVVADDLDVDSGTLHVDSINNRVGINKSSPLQELDVNGDLAVSGFISTTNYIESTSYVKAKGPLIIQDTGTSIKQFSFVQDQSPDQLRIYGYDNPTFINYLSMQKDTNTANSFVDVNCGYFGVGKTTKPTANLDVVGTGIVSSDFNAGGNLLNVDTGTTRVGINTASPATTLDVEGTFEVSGAANLGSTLFVNGTTTLDDKVTITGASSDPNLIVQGSGPQNGIIIREVNNANDAWWIVNDDGDVAGANVRLRIFHYNGTNYLDALGFVHSGTDTGAANFTDCDVGINLAYAATPASELEVNGTTTTTNIHISPTGVLRIPYGTSDPSSPVTGQMFYRSDSSVLKIWNGSAWKTTNMN